MKSVNLTSGKNLNTTPLSYKNLTLHTKRDLKNYELEMRIEELEAKFSKDFNETTFNELKELKKLQKTN